MMYECMTMDNAGARNISSFGGPGQAKSPQPGPEPVAGMPPRRYSGVMTCRFATFVLAGLAASGMHRASARPAGATSAPAPAGPAVVRIAVPDFPGADAIWGATGRDARGHIWFAVSSHAAQAPSARLFEYVPASGKPIDRGDALSALKRCGAYRPGEGQAKIHSRIVQAGDGHLYFASFDEAGEDQRRQILPKWGSHLWRLRLPEHRWEHLLAVPEGLIAVAATGKHVYALGYWEHKLYQYHCATGRVRSVKVGAAAGHVSRNIFTDPAGRVYVPRIAPAGRSGRYASSLVAYDAAVGEVGPRALKHYLDGHPRRAHGITAFHPLADGSVAFLTHNGRLSLLRAGADGRSALEDLGWFHPGGRSYAASLFADSGQRRLMGVAKKDRRQHWVVYDLKTRTATAAVLAVTAPKPESLEDTMLFGSMTRDRAGNFYVAGARGRRHGAYRPVLLKVRPQGPPPKSQADPGP